jgi:hypothetical protein
MSASRQQPNADPGIPAYVELSGAALMENSEVCDHLLLLLLLLLQTRTQPHLGCCLAAATAAASAIIMHLCTNSATPCTSRQHMRSCNDENGKCANRRSRLTTAVAGHEKSRWASSSTGRSCIPKAAHRLQSRANQTTP